LLKGPYKPYKVVMGKMTVAERVSMLRRDAMFARQEIDALMGSECWGTTRWALARLQRRAREKDAAADRLLQGGSSPEKLNRIIHIRMMVKV
jgi:hypothetical protein